MHYENPLDITQVINEKHISGICNTIINEFTRCCDSNLDTKVVPIIKNDNYNFYMIDYGFLVYSIETYIKNYYKIMKKDEEGGIKLAEKIHFDFAIDANKTLSKNGILLLSILKYFGICFENKKNKLYLRTLFRDDENNIHLLLNSVSINIPIILELSERANVEDDFITKHNTNFKYIAMERGANNHIKLLGETIKLYQFWSREDGYNKILTS